MIGKQMESTFQKALNNFVRDFGYGDAIMHLADDGFTLSQIKGRIGSHLPEEYLCERMIKSYVDRGNALLAEPGSAPKEKVSMVKDVGEFGQVSFRQVREIIEEPSISFVSYKWTGEDWEGDSLTGHLRRLEDGWDHLQEKIYASFLITAKRLSEWEDILSETQIDYLRCFLHLQREAYLLLDERVWEILKALLERHAYKGSVYLMSEGKKWILT